MTNATVHLIEADQHGQQTLYEVHVTLSPLAVKALDAGVPEAWRMALRGCRWLIAQHQARQAA